VSAPDPQKCGSGAASALLPDGRIETGIERVTDFAFIVDYGSNGY